MNQSRKKFLVQSAGLLSLSFLQPYQSIVKSFEEKDKFIDNDLPAWDFPPISNTIQHAVVISTVELLKTQGQLFLVVTARDGQKGITQCNDRMQHLTSLLKGLVIPHFVNQDARNILQLVDNAYRLNSNYKYAGMPLWNCIGSVEIAIWDLLGNIALKPAYQLLGNGVRNEYDVYISDFNREGIPEKIVEQLIEKLQITGAKGIKVKVGGRMSNTAENAAQTKRYVPALRKKLGDNIIIYADANGSYLPKDGIETGKFLEDYGITIFEEPCNFEDEEGMLTVSKALKKLKVAGGEQDTSIYRFKMLSQRKVYDILQPDLYYNGGMLRTLQVSAIAKKYGSAGIAPHTPKADPLIAPFWQVAAIIPNLYGLQECVYNPGQKDASWHSAIKIIDGKIRIPTTNGLGIQYDESIWQSAQRII